jgi:hypothetical protein
VAVFSIWQGGTCTGTFRLPIADLPRMVEALRRGPHGHDEQVTGERPGSREPRLPAPPGPPTPASPRPELLDRDIETGQTSAAVYAPPAEPELTGYQAAPPPPGYPPEPPGYPGQPQPGYRTKPTRRRRGVPSPAPPAEAAPGYRGADLAADPGGYPAGLAPGFPDEYPAGEDSGGYPGGPLAPGLPHEYPGGYQDQPAPGYPGEAGEGYPAGAGYLDEEAPGPAYPAEYPDEQDYPGYPDEPAATGYGPPAGPYLDDTPGMPGEDEPFADGPPEPSPDSFPYGPPPGGGQSRRRERYPRRH